MGKCSVWKPVVSMGTQAVKLHKNFVHFNYSLSVNKKNILNEYSSFFKPTDVKLVLLDR